MGKSISLKKCLLAVVLSLVVSSFVSQALANTAAVLVLPQSEVNQQITQKLREASSQTNYSKPSSVVVNKSKSFQKITRKKNGTAAFAKGKLSSGPIGGSLRDIIEQGWNHLKSNRSLSLAKADGSFVFQKLKEDRLQKKHAWYQQAHEGIPVWGKQVMFHMDEANQVYQFHGDYLDKPQVNITEPVIELELALEYAQQAVEAIDAELGVALNYFQTEGESRLAYKIELLSGLDKRWVVFIDAWNGDVLHKLFNIHHTGEVRSASGNNLSGEKVLFSSWFENNRYYLIDPAIPTFDELPSPLSRGPNPSGDTFVFDAKGTKSVQVEYVSSNNLHSGWDATAVTALQNTHIVYEYYLDTFSRDSLDGKGKNLLATVHFDKSFNNAFWNGSSMVYGDGDGVIFSPLVNCLDVAAHEMTHGVIENSANLIYQNQSGALNESFSDVFAIFIDRKNWTIGEDCTILSPGYLRSLAEPESGLDEQPRKMSDYVNLPNTFDGDNGGVHINSGIPNHAAYLFVTRLMALGVTENDAYQRAEQIYYRALTFYLHASAYFIDARRALISAAEDLYGSVEVNVLNEVWDEVEVFDFDEKNITEPAIPTSVSEKPGNDIMAYIEPAGNELNLYVRIYHDPDNASVDNHEYDGPINVPPPPNFGLNLPLISSRPAVVTNESGTSYYFLSSSASLYRARKGSVFYQTELVVDATRTEVGKRFRSIALSPDGRYFAYTTQNRVPFINVIDSITGEEKSYSIVLSNYRRNGEDIGSANSVLFANSLNFDFSSNKIVFDARNCISTPGSLCADGGGVQYWTVSILDLPSESVYSLMPEQSATINLGFPTFATNNNFIVAMDYAELDESVSPASYHSKVVSYNSETQEMKTLMDNGTATSQFFGVPSFWGDDQHLTTLIPQSIGGGSGGYIAQKITLTPEWGRDNSQPPIVLNDAAVSFPIMHRAAHRTISLLTFSVDVVNFGSVGAGRSKSMGLTISNKGDYDIQLQEISTSNVVFNYRMDENTLVRGESKTMELIFRSNEVDSYNGYIQIKTDGNSNPYRIPLFAKSTAKNALPVEQQTPIEGQDAQASTQQELFGCSVSSSGRVDWMLLLLLGMAIVGLARKRNY